MHWRMSVPHSDTAFGLPVIQVPVMPCHDAFLSGVDKGTLPASSFQKVYPVPATSPQCLSRAWRGDHEAEMIIPNNIIICDRLADAFCYNNAWCIRAIVARGACILFASGPTQRYGPQRYSPDTYARSAAWHGSARKMAITIAWTLPPKQ